MMKRRLPAIVLACFQLVHCIQVVSSLQHRAEHRFYNHSVLAHIFDYKYDLPQEQLRRGQVYSGSNFRLRKVVADLISGARPVKIGVIGGSIR
jgi:hypothetical protein